MPSPSTKIILFSLRLQQFGVTFGYKQVVIYVQPANTSKLTTNTARTTLLLNNDHWPSIDWAIEFRSNLPAAIIQLIEEKAAATNNTDHNKAIRERLKNILSLYNLSRYKPSEKGNYLIDQEQLISVGGFKNPEEKETFYSNKEEGTGGTDGNVYAVFEKTDGNPAKKITPDPFPQVRWVSVGNRTREPGDIEDRAAKFLADQNLLLINADFAAFNDLVDHLIDEHKDIPAIRNITLDIAKGWFEQALVESVMGVQGLINRKDWTQTDIEAAFSEEALTTSVMQRYHLFNAIKREVGSKIGSRKVA